MQHSHSQVIANSTVKDVIIPLLQQQIHVRGLCTRIPQYNQSYISKYAAENVHLDNFAYPPIDNPLHRQQSMMEDRQAQTIQKDEYANYLVNLQTDSKIPRITNQYQGEESTQRKTASTQMNKRGLLFKKEVIDPSKYFVPAPNPQQSPQKLRVKYPCQEEIDLETELGAMHKRLYETRKLQKQLQERQRLKLEEIQRYKKKNRQSKPIGDFTYSFEGKFMKRKKLQKDSFNTANMRYSVSHSCDNKQELKHSNSNILDDSQSQRGRSQLNSRYRKSETFNNFNKRQVSHLPFIKMSDNTMIKQYNKVSEGNKTQRMSYVSFSEKNEDKSFRHHHQIQKQKKDRELAEILRQRREQMEKDELKLNPELPNQTTQDTSGIRRRQSYMLNRYLKKIKEQNTQPIRRSMNFSPTSFPKSSAIHNFYRHNFDNERKLYQSEVVTKVLDQN